jgi:membrane-associated phospholipid phosphatase
LIQRLLNSSSSRVAISEADLERRVPVTRNCEDDINAVSSRTTFSPGYLANGLKPIHADRTAAIANEGPRPRIRTLPTGLRTGEKLLIVFFSYIALLTVIRLHPLTQIVLAWSLAVVVATLAWVAAHNTRGWRTVLRDWTTLALIPVAYWELQFFASDRVLGWQNTWILWDQHLLHDGRLAAAIEILGPCIPFILETTYLCLYAIPSFCLAALYVYGRRDRIDRLMTTLLLGALGAYALMPYFPSTSPRLAFPGSDLPHFTSFVRTMNVWVLDRFDISTSVFPSGHVAVAFASTFGLLRALPEKRWLAYCLFAMSTIVYVATVYSRYHYAVDGLAGAAVAMLAWRTSYLLEQHT